MKKSIVYLFILFSSASFAQINSYLRKADKAVGNNKIDLAKDLYSKAYALDKNNYEANLGVGFVLCEFMCKYEEALPYLETAYSKNTNDTFPDLVVSLGKCYQHIGDYKKAKELFSMAKVKITLDKDEEIYNATDLKKRMDDCDYAEQNKTTVYDKNIFVGNIGPVINTEMAEYVSVINDHEELIFTSRRKDSENEKRSDLDGKYFENMYISKLENGKPQAVKTYTLADHLLKTNHKRKHISVISASGDGKQLYLYQNNKIHEVITDANGKSTKALSKNVNMDYYQNHASISKDGKTLFFTSEDERGKGGLDIYKTTKGSDGEWGLPENLGDVINTPLDEDAPYLSDDGQTLYFSSKGHPGFGNYDIYKSTLTNGMWSAPENMKQPINSAGQDIFYMQSATNGDSYFASYRTGGYGDMDIYKITSLDKLNKECTEATNSLLTLKTTVDKATNLMSFEVTMPEKLKPVSYQWTFNRNLLTDNTAKITQNASGFSSDSVYVKVVASCDSCAEPLILCSHTIYDKPKDDVVVKVEEESGKNPYDDKLNLTYLNKTKIADLGLNLIPINFDLNKTTIRDEAITIWKKNIEILSKHPELSIIIYGFADSRGSEAYNLPLSKQRALKVKELLKSNGLKAKQIEQVVGKGESYILNKCVDGVECEDAEHEQNRRVEFILFEKKK